MLIQKYCKEEKVCLGQSNVLGNNDVWLMYLKKKTRLPTRPEENWASWPPFRFKTNCLVTPPAAGSLHQTLAEFTRSLGTGCIEHSELQKSCSYWFTCSGQCPDPWSLGPPPGAWARVCKEFIAGPCLTKPRWGTVGLKKGWWLLTRHTEVACL